MATGNRPGASAGLPEWLQGIPGQWQVTVHAQPGARKSEVAGEHNGALKVRIAAPPIEGRANAELLSFFARCFDVAKNRVELVAGASGRAKRVNLMIEHPVQVIVDCLTRQSGGKGKS